MFLKSHRISNKWREQLGMSWVQLMQQMHQMRKIFVCLVCSHALCLFAIFLECFVAREYAVLHFPYFRMLNVPPIFFVRFLLLLSFSGDFRCLVEHMAMHACHIGPTDTAPSCSGSPHGACVGTRGELRRGIWNFFHKTGYDSRLIWCRHIRGCLLER